MLKKKTIVGSLACNLCREVINLADWLMVPVVYKYKDSPWYLEESRSFRVYFRIGSLWYALRTNTWYQCVSRRFRRRISSFRMDDEVFRGLARDSNLGFITEISSSFPLSAERTYSTCFYSSFSGEYVLSFATHILFLLFEKKKSWPTMRYSFSRSKNRYCLGTNVFSFFFINDQSLSERFLATAKEESDWTNRQWLRPFLCQLSLFRWI